MYNTQINLINPPCDPYSDAPLCYTLTDAGTNTNVDPVRDRGLPGDGRTIGAFSRHGVGDLRTQPDLGKPHPHIPERWLGGEEVPLLQPRERWTRLRG